MYKNHFNKTKNSIDCGKVRYTALIESYFERVVFSRCRNSWRICAEDKDASSELVKYVLRFKRLKRSRT